MTRVLVGFGLALCTSWLTGCTGGSAAAASGPAPGHTLLPQQIHAIPIATLPPVSQTCPGQLETNAGCNIEERDDIEPVGDSDNLSRDQIPGYHPTDIQRAYGLPQIPGGAIAIVVPYHDASAQADLAVYRAKFGLPACTTHNGCLRFIAQDGTSRLPASSAQWSIETSVDLEIASAACPTCPLIVVEASSDGLSDMIAALHQAIAQHPSVVSNSWVVPESEMTPSAPLAHNGVAIVAGSGDRANGVSWPASDPTVIAVGGTTLAMDDSQRGFSESAWSGAGFGCSAFFAKPAWQSTACTTRAVADVSAVADPSTGVAIYDSVPLKRGAHRGLAGWGVYGGTSVATPIVAAAIALANNGAQLSTPQYLYRHSSLLNVVSSVSSPLQAGLGSPNGTAAF